MTPFTAALDSANSLLTSPCKYEFCLLSLHDNQSFKSFEELDRIQIVVPDTENFYY